MVTQQGVVLAAGGISMLLFHNEVQEAVEHLRRGLSVEVTGQHGVGRTTFARAVTERLERVGFVVHTLNGGTYPQPEPYGALRRAGLAPSEPTTATRLVETVARELTANPNTCLVLDDAETIDDETLAVVADARSRSGTPLLATTLPYRRASLRVHRWFPAERSARIVLHPLSYEITSRLVHSLLDGPLDPEIVSRVYAKSSGITSLVGSIVRTAVLAGNLTQQDGVWSMAAETLWNSHLNTVIDQLLAGLGPDEFRTAYELAVLGSATLEQVEAIGRLADVERLEEVGLVTVVGDPTRTALVALNPLVLVDYFRNRPLEVTGIVLSRRLSEILHIPEHALLQDTARGTIPAALPTTAGVADRSQYPVLSRYFTDRRAAESAVQEREWNRDPSVRNALAYITVLSEQSNPAGVFRAIFDRTDPQASSATEDDLLLYAFVKAYWQTTLAHSSRAVAQTRRWLVELLPESSAEAEAIGIFMHAIAVSIRQQDLARLRVFAAARPESWVVQFVLAAVSTIAGHPDEALSVLASQPSRTPAAVQRYTGFFHVLALADKGSLTEGTALAVSMLNEARLNLDGPRVHLFSYAAALCMFQDGRWEETGTLLSETLTLRQPGEPSRQLYYAMLRLNALLLFRSGQTATAESLLREADLHGEAPLPWTNQSIGSVVRAVITGNDPLAADNLLEEAMAGVQRGYFPLAKNSLLFALALDPTVPRVDLFDAVVAASPGTEAHLSLRTFARAALEAPADIVDHARAYSTDIDLSVALQVARAIADRADEAGDAELTKRAEGAEAILAGRLGRETAARRPVVSRAAVQSLTSREAQIAQLAANHTNAEVAAVLHLSRRTVENHISRAFKKTGTSTRAELADVALSFEVG